MVGVRVTNEFAESATKGNVRKTREGFIEIPFRDGFDNLAADSLFQNISTSTFNVSLASQRHTQPEFPSNRTAAIREILPKSFLDALSILTPSQE